MQPFSFISPDDSLSFGSPEWLWALWLMVPIGWFFIQAGRKRGELLAKILAPRLQQQLAGRVSPLKRNLRMGFLLMSLALIIIALAQPRFGYAQREIKSHGRDVIIGIDTSRSMLATDAVPTRLGRAKLISQDLLNLLKGDRVGLIAFAGTAFLQAPLTLDKGAVLTSIQDLDTNTIPKGGTDIAAAIRMAIAAFGKGEGSSRILVLMTDGEDLEASAVEAAKEAGALGIKIFTIGFGSATGSLIPIKTESGQNDFVRDEQGNPVNSKMDEARLTEITKATGGFYQSYGQDAAQVIYDKGILPIEARENGTLTARKPIERYAWPATAALVLLSLWSLLGEGRRKGGGLPMAIAVGLVLLPMPLHASGISDYQKGNYEGALKYFEDRLKSGSTTPQVTFDAGAAAYKAGDYKKAAGYFSEVMTSSNPKIRDAATYNLANSLVRTGEAAKEDDAKLSDWKNSLQHYETVLKETPGNTQAKENRDIVKKLIEDLKKQQEQKKQQDKKNDQKKDQNKDKDQKDQQKNDQSKGDGKSDQQKNQDQQKGESKDQKDQQNQSKDSQGGKDSKDQKDQQSKDQQDAKGQPSPQQGQQDQKGGASPTPSPSATPNQDKGSNGQKEDQKDQQGKQDQQDSKQPKEGEKDQQNGRNGQGSQPTPTPAPTPSDKKEGALSGGQQGQKPEDQKAAEAAAAEEGKDGTMTTNQASTLLRSVQDEEQHVLNQQQRAVEQSIRNW